MDLYTQMLNLINDLDLSIKSLAKNGERLAEAEKEYKTELTKQALQLKADGTAVTFINLIIHGQPEVARKRLERDIAEANYKANQEFINITKLKLKICESQLQREWGKDA